MVLFSDDEISGEIVRGCLMSSLMVSIEDICCVSTPTTNGTGTRKEIENRKKISVVTILKEHKKIHLLHRNPGGINHNAVLRGFRSLLSGKTYRRRRPTSTQKNSPHC
jgi:hypothetical protein